MIFSPLSVIGGVLVWAAIVLWAPEMRAEAFRLSPGMPVESPLRFMSVREDPSGQLTFDEIRSDPAAFQPLVKERTSLGITSSAWWLRFEATNPENVPVEWVFNVPFPLFDLVDVFVLEEGKDVRHFALGDKRPLASRPLVGEGFAVPIITDPGESTTVYLRLQSPLGDGLDAHFEVSSLTAYAERQLNVWMFLGIMLGGAGVLFLYNLVVCLVVRDRLYLWYLLYLFFGIWAFVAASGIGDRFIWSHRGTVSEMIPPLTSALAFLFVIQFSRSFLETRRVFPRIDWFLRVLMAYFLVPPLAFLGGESALAAKLIMSGCIALAMLPFLGVVAWLRGQKTALIFALAWGFWFACISPLSARMLGLLPTNDFTLRLGWIGILGEAILFALALAGRIRLLRMEKSAAEAREHDALRRSKEELEALVQERTQELAAGYEELRRLNREKDKLFSIVAHDLRNPFAGVINLADILSREIHNMPPQEVDEYLRHLRQSAETFHRLLENLLSWATLQLGGFKFSPETFELAPVADRCASLFAQSAHEKNVRIEIEGTEGLRVRADRQMLEMIIRNLLSNAIKYSHPGGRVLLAARRTDSGVEIAVSDEGVGMDSTTAASLFDFTERKSTPGTAGESGTGLGLQLCKELVEKHGGKITVESRPDEGTIFRFILPQGVGG